MGKKSFHQPHLHMNVYLIIFAMASLKRKTFHPAFNQEKQRQISIIKCKCNWNNISNIWNEVSRGQQVNLNCVVSFFYESELLITAGRAFTKLFCPRLGEGRGICGGDSCEKHVTEGRSTWDSVVLLLIGSWCVLFTAVWDSTLIVLRPN